MGGVPQFSALDDKAAARGGREDNDWTGPQTLRFRRLTKEDRWRGTVP